MPRARLKIEPYDSGAVDGDGDGIVQEGTAWERPAGTKLIDEFGKEILRGLTSQERPMLSTVVDANGRTVAYTPSYGLGGGGQAGLSRLGYRSLIDRGLRSLGSRTGKESLGPKLTETIRTSGEITAIGLIPNRLGDDISAIKDITHIETVGLPLDDQIRTTLEVVTNSPDDVTEVTNVVTTPLELIEDEDSFVTPNSKAETVLAKLMAVGVNWRRDRRGMKRAKEQGLRDSQEIYEKMTPSAKEFLESEDKSLESMGLQLVKIGESVRIGKTMDGVQRPVRFSELSDKEKLAVTRELINKSGNEEALKEFDDFIAVLARGDSATIAEASQKLMSKAGSRFDDRVQVWTSSDAAEKIIDSGKVLTAHDTDEGVRGFGLFENNPEYTAEIRKRAEAGLYGLPIPKKGEPDTLKGMRPTSGEAIPRAVSGEHAEKMREIYGDDVPVLHDYALGSSSEFSKAGRSYGRLSPARLILKKETSERTRIHWGDAISNTGDSVILSEVGRPENANLMINGAGFTPLPDLLVYSLGDAEAIRSLRMIRDTDHYNETATIGGIELDDIDAVIMQPSYSHYLVGEELLGPGLVGVNPAFQIQSLVGAMRYKDEMEDSKGLKIVVDHLSDEVELDNPAMTRKFIERSPQLFKDVDLSFVDDETTPYEAILHAEMQKAGEKADAKFVPGIKQELERVKSRRADVVKTDKAAEKVIQRNNEVREAIERAGGSFTGDIDQAFKEANASSGFERVPIETKAEAIARRDSQVRKDIQNLRAAVLQGSPTRTGPGAPGILNVMRHAEDETDGIDQRQFERISPGVRELLETKSDDELMDILRTRAVEFHKGLDKRPRVRIGQETLEAFIEDGRYKTTHEARSAHSGPGVRAQYETYLGVPGNIDPSLRPASGYMSHPDWEEYRKAELGDTIKNASPERVLAYMHDGQLSPNGYVSIYGDTELILRPEVAGRTRYGRDDSLANFLRPVSVESEDSDEIMHALLWTGGRQGQRGPQNVIDLLQSEVDGNFGKLNFWHAQSDDPEKDFSKTRIYFEALIFGSFSPSDVEEVRIQASMLENLGKAVDPDGLSDEAFKDLFSKTEFLKSFGFSDEEIAYIMREKSEKPWSFGTWFGEYKRWKRQEKAKEMLDKIGSDKITILRDGRVDADPFVLQSYGGHETVTSIEELMRARTLKTLRDDIKRSIEQPKNTFEWDEGESVA